MNTERLMWANDFPHSDATWPNSQAMLAEHARQLDDAGAVAHPPRQRRRPLRDPVDAGARHRLVAFVWSETEYLAHCPLNPTHLTSRVPAQ